MPELFKWNNIFFIGIGGIGMSALARWFKVNGFAVAGYDKTPSPLTKLLEEEGCQIHYEDNIDLIPENFRNADSTLVVLTPAIPASHSELKYFQSHQFKLLKRSQILGQIAGAMQTAAVAGTHGKTTTTSMLAHLLRSNQVNCAAFLGGITQNYGTNFLLNEPTDDLSQVTCVVEADEFDRSFLTLFPELAAITSTDADHLDIYGDKQALQRSFEDFVNQIKPGGTLFMRHGLAVDVNPSINTLTYGLHEGDIHTQNLRIAEGAFIFDLVTPTSVITDIQLYTPGFHNVENALAASALALEIGLTADQIRDSFSSFRGVKRRFEYIINRPDKVFIDDYAHHPTEIEAFLTSVKAIYPGRHLTVIFQPHLFSRTRDFADEFAQALKLADRLFLLEIYPAREEPIEGVDSIMLLKKIDLLDKRVITKQEVTNQLCNLDSDIVVTVGAGDIDRLIGSVMEALTQPA